MKALLVISIIALIMLNGFILIICAGAKDMQERHDANKDDCDP